MPAGEKGTGNRRRPWASKMGAAADLVEQAVHETLTFYGFPDIQWQKIRANNPLERIVKEILRCFPRRSVLPQLGGGATAVHRRHNMVGNLPHKHATFTFDLRTVFRFLMAAILRLNFSAIKTTSVFKASSGCASSAGVHGRLAGAGLILISFPLPIFPFLKRRRAAGFC
jgi:hypothetical protein